MSRLISVLIFIVGICFGVSLTMLDDFGSMRQQYELGFQKGKKAALNTRPPSDDLEAVCAGLWVSSQNRIYMEREQK